MLHRTPLALLLPLALAAAPSAAAELYAVARSTGATPNGHILAIDTDTDSVTTLASGSWILPTGGLALAGGTLYVGTDGIIQKFDVASNSFTGSIIATNANSATHNALAVAGDTLFSVVDGDFSADILRLDRNAGIQPASLTPVFTDVKTMATDSGALFVGGHSSIAQRGSLGASGFEFFAACGSMVNSMAFSDSTLFLGGETFFGSGGTVYKFDKFAGGVNYSGTFPVASDARAIAFADGTLFVAGTNGLIQALDPDTGAALAATIDTGLEILGMIPATSATCPADFNADSTLDFGDVAAFINLYLAADTAADLNGDGLLDFGDAAIFIAVFDAGC